MSAGQWQVLVVEDERDIRNFLMTSLEAEGLAVWSAASGAEALAILANRTVDLVVLDLGLPDMEGVDVVRRLRDTRATPVLVLSARADEAQKVAALDAGADDYLTKPFGIGELSARIRVALRRLDGRSSGPATQDFMLDGLRVDLSRHRVQLNGVDIHLTPIEQRLVERLARDAGKVVTHRQLLRDVWGAEFVEHTHYLRIYMGQLRAKLESNPADPRFLLTETGVGYRLADE